MKNTILILIASACLQVMHAQKDYTMQEAVLGLGQHLRIENVDGLKLLSKDRYQRTIKGEQEQYMIHYSLIDPKRMDTVLTLGQLNNYFYTQKDTLMSFPSINWKDDGGFSFSRKGVMYHGQRNATTKSVMIQKGITIPKDAENITADKDQQILAYTIKNNLYCIDASGQTHQISNDSNAHIINGQSVHRNEFGINGGIFIAPNSRYIAYYKMDESMVADYPVIEWNGVPATVNNIKYPMAGDTSHQVSLWIYDLATRRNTKVNVNNNLDDYLTNITWQPNSAYIYITHLDRAQQHLSLCKYDAITGMLDRIVLEEQSDKYVEPQHQLYFLPNGKEFLYYSQRDGYMHLYHYDINGRYIKQVTKGAFVVNDIIGINAKSKNIYITANASDPREQQIYAVNYDKGTMSAITTASGVHQGVVSDDGQYIIDEYKNESNPRTVSIIHTKTLKATTLLTAKNTLSGYNNARVQHIQLSANDGTPLYGKLMLPHDFDSTKRYPVIVYLYNGPHVQLITRSFPESGNLWYDYLTQRGFIVFSMDGRGSSNRGLAFEQATHRNLGTVEMDDQLVGVSYLKGLPFVAADRMGVHGWSYGGFMTTSLMTRHPGVFKVGVAGGPVIDWSMYEIMYTERYMGTPQNNKSGYEANELTAKAKNLEGKLLMIHGADDDVVVWQHSIKFVKACVDAGKQIDYFVYPGHPHNVRGKDRVHLMQKITDYFVEYL